MKRKDGYFNNFKKGITWFLGSLSMGVVVFYLCAGIGVIFRMLGHIPCILYTWDFVLMSFTVSVLVVLIEKLCVFFGKETK